MKILIPSLILFSLMTGCGSKSSSSGGSPSPATTHSVKAGLATVEQAIKRAYVMYRLRKRAGISFKNGPCISNGKDIPGWVVDIAHNPRQPIDNRPNNQCSAFLSGKVPHFVELDLKGRLIRTGP